jgi:hypothetical protein
MFFYVATGTLYKAEYPYGGAVTISQMTAKDVFVSSLIFYLEGAHTSDGSNDEGGASDYIQPVVTLLISGHTKPEKIRDASTTPFSLQTAVSVREPDGR